MATAPKLERRYAGGGQFVTSIRTYGFKQLSKTLLAFDKQAKRDMNKALRKAAAPIVAAAKARAPHGKGKLQGSIGIRTRLSGFAIGSRLAYAPVLEFAFHSRASRAESRAAGVHQRETGVDYSSLSTKYGPPPRYLIPSVDEHAAQVRNDVQQILETGIARVFAHNFNAPDGA